MDNRILQAYNRWLAKEEEFSQRYGRAATSGMDFQKLKWRVLQHIVSQSKRVLLSLDERDELLMVRIKADTLMREINGGRDLSFMQRIGRKLSDVLHPDRKYNNMREIFLQFKNAPLPEHGLNGILSAESSVSNWGNTLMPKRLLRIDSTRPSASTPGQTALESNFNSLRLFQIKYGKKDLEEKSGLRAIYVRQNGNEEKGTTKQSVIEEGHTIKLKKKTAPKPIINDKLIVSVKL
ncbi:hypothetical protein HGH92_26675 [Chitinophaga varians]|uniref:Uncharacterized protein n=1 Tax=Chitinophaga varians TaxID=2202339 RepID=A0A847S490_9BACT|nr:hypothetical protein [Chitinophaga varians]NLR67918.1 hypothetical protein [Chitinophaga varians]